MKLQIGLAAIAVAATALGLGIVGEKKNDAPDYVMHEWGTFTSVYGSDGTMLTGLQREEEHLPGFVHAHAGMENVAFPGVFTKGWRRPLKFVTVKMETPVIYFYSEEGFKGSVDVGFKGGSISQWFPQRQGGEVPPKVVYPKIEMDETGQPKPIDPLVWAKVGLIDFEDGKYEGDIKWDFEVLPPDARLDDKVFRSGETLNWLRPRQTASNVVKVGEEYEKYLFYRGVGNFELPIEFKVNSEETLTIKNAGEEAVPYALVYERTEAGQVGIYEFSKGIKPGATVSIDQQSLFPPTGEEPRYVLPAVGPEFEKMVNGLKKCGLRHDEASAMVQTWWDSYFGKPGLRVFWVVPAGDTEEVLPLNITPKPREMVRVLVGRSEILRPSFEQRLVKDFQAEKRDKWNYWAQDRYGQAYLERVKAILPPEEPKIQPPLLPGLQSQ